MKAMADVLCDIQVKSPCGDIGNQLNCRMRAGVTLP